MLKNDKVTEVQVSVAFMQLVQDLKTLMEILGDREVPLKKVMKEFDAIDKNYNEFITTSKEFLRCYREEDFSSVM